MAVMVTRRAFNRAFLPSLRSLGSQVPRQRDDMRHVWDPDRIAWQPDDPPGAKYALLDGDRNRPGALFSYAFWLPGGVWTPAHYHSQDAHVCVVRGTLKLGFGSRRDKSRRIGNISGGGQQKIRWCQHKRGSTPTMCRPPRLTSW